MVGAFIDQRFSLGTNNQGLFVAWNAELWPASYKNWRDDGGFAFGVRPGFSLGYEGSLEDRISLPHSTAAHLDLRHG